MTLDLRLDVAAVVLFALFVALGLHVSRRPLTRPDALAIYFRGQITPLALLFTVSGRSPALTAGCIVAILVFALLRLSVVVPIVMTASQLISQIVVEYGKTLFKRMRPDYWLVGLEAGHSYPSGHAVTAMVFFVGWAVLAAMSKLPNVPKNLLVAALCAWALGIVWSRLALGAHYLSDVTGGVLFGGAWLCALGGIFLPVFYVFLR